jgi:hypothetical protein
VAKRLPLGRPFGLPLSPGWNGLRFVSFMVGEPQPLPYRIEMWDDHDAHVEELIALVTDHAVALSLRRST